MAHRLRLCWRCRGFPAMASCLVRVPVSHPTVSETPRPPRHHYVRVAVTAAALAPALLLSLASRGGGQALDTSATAVWREYQRTVQPFLARHCFECHTERESGDVRLDLFKDEK